MTQQDAIRHWRDGAKDELEAARILHREGKYRQSLFLCHLSIEKALKAAYLAERNEDPPKIHNLYLLAQELKQKHWSPDQLDLLSDLSDFAVDARYDDPGWAEKLATQDTSALWIGHTDTFLSFLQ